MAWMLAPGGASSRLLGRPVATVLLAAAISAVGFAGRAHAGLVLLSRPSNLAVNSGGTDKTFDTVDDAASISRSPGDAVFTTTADPSREVEPQTFRPPGAFRLKIWAGSPGLFSTGSSAYYTVDLTLNPIASPPTDPMVLGNEVGSQPMQPLPGNGAMATPLPPAAWSGLMMLAGVAAMMLRLRWRAGRLRL